ncbi:MAG: proline dehydrogenase [Candidatus Marinimicrobia bacterium]|jgi:proline dehydrogenase|nr:proline dehydrogenase [Candidatus Neomarinimicrobiota bacterium]MBT3501864.1 proline dehydrogenase [Candidatus Neomarinimicrobiota bacterium]MBT3838610.1 proline dehydrogenase [Candidatus Neomarinimicrobiota bacterium]MBT3999776.1 proline dehydrogenase [Candidatus Neomarinimicrobiota bacterium]MBT4578645.1 proline dehydrogenase [Candidatus Neomarinimicrobiota bacterium]
MSFFNSIVTNALPILPKWFAKPFAKPYVAGETEDDAIIQIRNLNEKGFLTTVDILGEHINTKEDARLITSHYCNLYDRINLEALTCNISLKPTHVGLYISLAEAMGNITTILKKAKENNNFLRIDMENSPFTDQTFEIYNHCKTIYNQVGVVIQSYLHRSLNDVQHLANEQFNSRICKGIYKESEKIAYHEPEKINENFLSIAKSMILKKSFSAYATHDQDLIDQLLNWIETEKISKDLFEFQVLYGVPMGGRLEALLNTGYKVRVYVPYGPDWFDYSVRRLNENPKVISYVMKNIFRTK